MKQSQLKRTTGLKAKTGFKNKISSFKTTKKSSFKRKKMEDETPQKILDSLVSQGIRMGNADQDGNCTCATCGAVVHWTKIQCGHFQDRQHMATRYFVMNLAPQCMDCNMFNDGQQEKFAMYIDRVHGKGTALSLKRLAGTTVHNYPYEKEIEKWTVIVDKLKEKFNQVIQY